MEPREAKGSMQRGVMVKHTRENTGQKPLVRSELKLDEEKVVIEDKKMIKNLHAQVVCVCVNHFQAFLSDGGK